MDLLLANEDLAFLMQKSWLVYSETLNLLVRFLPSSKFEIQYLLQEDHDTRAFTGFSDSVKTNRLCGSTKQAKPVHSEAIFGPRFPDKEILYRIKGLLVDGVRLVKEEVSHVSQPACHF